MVFSGQFAEQMSTMFAVSMRQLEEELGLEHNPMTNALTQTGDAVAKVWRALDDLNTTLNRTIALANNMPDVLMGAANAPARTLMKHSSSLMNGFQDVLSRPEISNDNTVVKLATKLIQTRTHKPIVMADWASGWVKQKQLNGTTKAAAGQPACIVCMENEPDVILKTCACPSNYCSTCALKHFFESTESCTKTFAQCMTCRAEHCVNDIVPSVNAYAKGIMKNKSVRLPMPHSDVIDKCKDCHTKNATHSLCADCTLQPEYCEACAFQKIWNSKYGAVPSPFLCDGYICVFVDQRNAAPGPTRKRNTKRSHICHKMPLQKPK